MRRKVRFTRFDLGLALLGVLVAVLCAFLVQMTNLMVSPPRPRISTSARPVLGLALRETEDGGLRVERAFGPAASAGLEAGDRIVRLDALRSPSIEAFLNAVTAAPAGTVFTIEARRSRPEGTDSAVLVEAQSEARAISPAEEGVPFETVAFPNPAGLTLRGWYVPPPPGTSGGRAPAVVYGHGNGSDRRQWLPLARRIHEAGIAQLFLDFAGRGDSDGDVITLGGREAGDLVAGIDWLARRPEVDPDRIGAAGKSMGAVATILAASREPRIRVLVLDSPFADLADVVDRAVKRRHLPASLLRPLIFRVAGWRAGFEPGALVPERAIAEVGVPALLLHGDADGLVPIEHARRLVGAARGPVTFVPLAGEGHNTRRSRETLDRIARYLEGSLAR